MLTGVEERQCLSALLFEQCRSILYSYERESSDASQIEMGFRRRVTAVRSDKNTLIIIIGMCFCRSND